MAIYATRIGSDMSLANINVKIEEPIPNNSTLVYDGLQKSFVLKSSDDTLPAITGAVNLGGNNAQGIFSQKNGSLLEFKELISGNGITITSTNDSLTIAANNLSTVSVPNDYIITINNGDTDPTAKFQIYTAKGTASNPIVINAIPSIQPIVVNNLYTGNSNGQGFIQTVNGFDFINYGFIAGMWITLQGTAAQDNYWQISHVVNTSSTSNNTTNHYSTIYFTQEFIGNYGFALGGPQHPTIITQYDLVVLNPDPTVSLPLDPTKSYTISSFKEDFGPAGLNLIPNMVFKLAGSLTNDGYYTIYNVTPKGTNQLSEITIIPAFNQAGPINQNATLTFNAVNIPTGFSVDQHGYIISNGLTVQSQIKMGNTSVNSIIPVEPNDLIRKDYIDSIIKPSKGKALLYFYSSF